MVKTHSEKIREAVTDLGIASPNEIMDWIIRHYPNDTVNPQSYRADIIGCSKNHSSQHHYPNIPKFLWFEKETKKYRLADSDEKVITPINEALTKISTNNETTYIDGVPVTSLSVTGQIVIPQKVREDMGFEPGDTLAFITNEKGFLELRKAKLRLDLQ